MTLQQLVMCLGLAGAVGGPLAEVVVAALLFLAVVVMGAKAAEVVALLRLGVAPLARLVLIRRSQGRTLTLIPRRRRPGTSRLILPANPCMSPLPQQSPQQLGLSWSGWISRQL